VVVNKYGAGRAIYSAASIEADDAEANEQMFTVLVQSMLDQRLAFSADAHPAVWMAAFDQADRGRVMVSFLNYQVDLPPAPLPVAFSIRPPAGKRFTALSLVPDGGAIGFVTDADGSIRASLDSVGLMEIVVADYS
jgi:hypothetical protein